MTSEAADPKNTRRVYDQAAQEYERIFFDDLSDERWLRSFAGSLRSPSLILDVGSGPGNFSSYIGSQGHRPICIDISFEMLAVGRLRRGVTYPMVQGTMEKLPFQSNVFDGLLIAYSLLHLPKRNTFGTLGELRRVCKRDGRALLLLKEGAGEDIIDASLVPGESLIVSTWHAAELQPLLESTGWDLVSVERGEPVKQEEIQQPKLALSLVAT